MILIMLSFMFPGIRKRSSLNVSHLAARKSRKGEKPAGQANDFSFLADEFGTELAEDYMDFEIGDTSPIGMLDDVTNPLDFRI